MNQAQAQAQAQVSVLNGWTRSEDGWLAGVCEGLAQQFEINPNVLRLLWIASLLVFGFGFLLYFIFAFCLPVEGKEEEAYKPKVLGVCMRLSEKLDIDIGLVRVLTVMVALGSFGVTVVFYLLLHFLLNKKNNQNLEH